MVATLLVLEVLNCLPSDSNCVRIMPIGGVLAVQAGAAPVQLGSLPPRTVTVLVALLAAGPTWTGAVMTILPTAAPAAMVQPVNPGEPAEGQPLNVPPVAVTGPLVTMPV